MTPAANLNREPAKAGLMIRGNTSRNRGESIHGMTRERIGRKAKMLAGVSRHSR